MSNNKPYTEDELRKQLRPYVCKSVMRPPNPASDPAVEVSMQKHEEAKLNQVMRIIAAHTQPKQQQPRLDVEKEIDLIMEDCAVGHNFDYAGKALKELFARQKPTASGRSNRRYLYGLPLPRI